MLTWLASGWARLAAECMRRLRIGSTPTSRAQEELEALQRPRRAGTPSAAKASAVHGMCSGVGVGVDGCVAAGYKYTREIAGQRSAHLCSRSVLWAGFLSMLWYAYSFPAAEAKHATKCEN